MQRRHIQVERRCPVFAARSFAVSPTETTTPRELKSSATRKELLASASSSFHDQTRGSNPSIGLLVSMLSTITYQRSLRVVDQPAGGPIQSGKISEHAIVKFAQQLVCIAREGFINRQYAVSPAVWGLDQRSEQSHLRMASILKVMVAKAFLGIDRMSAQGQCGRNSFSR
jgi:hypothetical protein